MLNEYFDKYIILNIQSFYIFQITISYSGVAKIVWAEGVRTKMEGERGG